MCIRDSTYQVPYDYYICTVTLENFDLSHVPVYVMGEDQLSRYAIYMATLGNRPDLFPDSPYVNKYITGKPGDYEVPGEYLDDETFAAMLAEAQKYIGYPYVWGGSSPATSFDCSGYVSWVINHSGWNVGRLGAQGLYNICTPVSYTHLMGEYAPLVRRLGGQVIEIAPDSPHHLNPMDVELNMAAGESPLSMKADFLLSLCELVVGGKEGLQPIEKTVIDRCVRLVYREQALGLETAKTPLLQDLYEELLRQPEPEARRVATALELYCTGSLNLFNHPTNVKTDSRVVCIVLKNMGENLRKIAMHITNEFVSQAVDQNFHEGAATWCYFDEFHILLRDPLTASYFVAVWKMLRKKGCVPSALTQNVKDLLASREIENILDNTDFMILLSQAQSDRTILAKQLGISEHQLSYITHSNSGEGLLFYGNVTIPFVDRFPRGEIYDLLTTRPEDMKNETKNE